VREVPISDDLIDYVSKVVRATRPETTTNAYVKEWVSWGAGPRAGQAMILTAKARALLDGRLAVTLDDLKQVAIPVLRHRIIINFKGEAEGIDSDNVKRIEKQENRLRNQDSKNRDFYENFHNVKIR